MRSHIDVEGASGQSYRFRIWPEDGVHAPMPGNFVFVRQDPDAVALIYAGEINDLSMAQARWPEALETHGATDIFTRLNVSGAVRRAEQADIRARHHPPMID